MGLATAGPIGEPPDDQENDMAKPKAARAPEAPDEAGADAAATETQSYVAKTHIVYDGDDYFDGDPIELLEKDAKPLRDCGAIEASE